jgi:hypothetical protein
LRFWFEELSHQQRFSGDAEIDAMITERFLWHTWTSSSGGILALSHRSVCVPSWNYCAWSIFAAAVSRDCWCICVWWYGTYASTTSNHRRPRYVTTT